MRKFWFLLIACVAFISCTEQRMVRQFGTDGEIKLPKGEKLIEVTWKEANLWYLTAPMEDGYVPQTKIFREDSEWGIMQGSIKFVESR